MCRNTECFFFCLFVCFNNICCYSAIEAMRKAHKEEMDKTQKALQNGANVDIHQLRAQYKCVCDVYC